MKGKFPNTYVIIFFVILLCAVATWMIPGGEYVNDNAGLHYENVDAVPQTWQVFPAIYHGFKQQAGIIIFILVVGGSFWIVNGSGAIDVGIKSFLKWMSRMENNALVSAAGSGNIVITAIILLFSLFGAVFGMSEECIPFVAVVVPLAISMGYDSIVGLLMVYAAAHVGFAGAFLNPFTIGVAQGMAGLELFSGIGYRLICWGILTALLIAVTLLYASRVRRNPRSSIMYDLDSVWRERHQSSRNEQAYYRNRGQIVAFVLAVIAIALFTAEYSSSCCLSLADRQIQLPWLLWALLALFVSSGFFAMRKSVHFFILTLLASTVVYLIVGVMCYSWYIPEITGLFLAMGILSGIASGKSANSIADEFLCGAKDILSAALVIGLACGVIIILQDGKVLDSILHSLQSGMDGTSPVASLSLMYGIQTVFNFIIPSATAKAAITIPIMAPFSDLVGLSRQAMVLAFQFGDGFTNMITPTSGVLIAALGMAGIPYGRWVKWVWKFILLLVVAGFLLLLASVLAKPVGF